MKIGLVAALSGQSAASGEAITRGLTVAIDEINGKGGVLGGIDSPVSLANAEKKPFIGVWAAATRITRNGATPTTCFASPPST